MFLKFFRKKERDLEPSRATVTGKDTSILAEMYYCASCGGEFRLDLGLCPTCRTALTSGADRLAQSALAVLQNSQQLRQLKPGETLVALRKGPLPEMKYLLRVLEKGHVPGLLSGDENGCTKGCRGPEMYLQIREDDVDRALLLLSEDFIKSTSLNDHDLCNAAAVFDSSSPETVCPACGNTFRTSIGACPDCGLSFE